MLNPFFLQGSKSEQGLLQDLINEQLRMYGVDVFYLPRQYVTERSVIREVIESEFNNAYPIEAYIENYEGYSDNPTILSKFGIQALNEITLTISRERFKNYISPLIKNQEDIKVYTRPREGDIIYFPLGRRLFEIKYVEHEKPFYQLQGLYTYQLRCELYRYEDELIDTDIDEIDELIGGSNENDPNSIDPDKVSVGHNTKLILTGVGVTATATATIVNGGVRFVTVTNRGGGYVTFPKVGFSSSPAGGKTPTAIVEMIDGIVCCDLNINPQARSVQKILVNNSGYGYTVAPGVRIFDGGGSGATAVATLGDGIVGIVTITNGGSGYVLPPSITFTGLSTVSASATAIVSSAGTITSILLTNSGLGYAVPPSIVISSPPSTTMGTFKFNELVTGSISGVTARVKSWNSVTNSLQVSNINGNFIVGENIVGSVSNASYCLSRIETPTVKDGYLQNDEIEEEADEIIDFDEQNPFGMP